MLTSRIFMTTLSALALPTAVLAATAQLGADTSVNLNTPVAQVGVGSSAGAATGTKALNSTRSNTGLNTNLRTRSNTGMDTNLNNNLNSTARFGTQTRAGTDGASAAGSINANTGATTNGTNANASGSLMGNGAIAPAAGN